MRFRSRLFGVLFILALLYTCGGLWYTSSIASRNIQDNSSQENTEARNVGTGIGAGIIYAIVLCPGIPLLLLFGLLSWRNSAGLATERRHQEQLNALRPPSP